MNVHFTPFKRVFAVIVAIATPIFAFGQIQAQQLNTGIKTISAAELEKIPTIGNVMIMPGGYGVVAPTDYLNTQQAINNDYTLAITTEPGATVIKVDFNGYNLQQVQTQQGLQSIATLKGGYAMLVKGAPDLYQVTLPVQIPNTGNTQVGYVDVQYTVVENVEIAPSKGNLKRTINPDDIAYQKGSVYSQNDFWPASYAELDAPYVLRDTRGQALHIRPYQYNPVTKTLRVIGSITLKVMNIGGIGVNEITSTTTHPDDEFTAIYKNHYVNFGKAEKYTPIPESGDMLIIADPSFMSAMQPYIKWKIKKGIKTEMVSVATVGNTTTAIKNYITNYYNSHNLTYVLLVGDLAQVTSPDLSGGKSDPSYGYISGNDSYAEVIIGRFSAESVAHVNTQVAKVLKYEINPPTGNTRFDHTTHIASNEGPGDNNEMDWEHERVIKNKLLAFTYTDHNEYYDGTHPAGGNDATNNPSASDIVSVVNTGTGIINYTGHGSTTSWATSGFGNGNIGSLTNTSGIWPFIWSVGCVNGEFNNGTCFGEAWMRATYNGQPAGSIANFMSSINQSWSPPMAGQDGMVDVLAGLTTPGQRSFGGISVNGCLFMNDVYNTAGDEMTNTWHCFGDPSVIIRTKDPMAMVTTHQPTIAIATTQIAVTCSVEGALVAVSQNNTLLGRAFVSGGVATVTIPALNAPDTVFVTATAFNYVPYLGHMLVGASGTPYVVLSSHAVEDVQFNQNNQPDFGENDGIYISLNNIGAIATGALTVKLRTTNPYVTITDSVYTTGSILAQGFSILEAAFGISIANNVPDQEVAHFDVVITNGIDTWTSYLTLTLNAPDLSVPSHSITEATGNNNGRLEATETGTITFANLNGGHADATNAGTLLYGGDSYVTVTGSQTGTIPALNVNTPEDESFTLDIAANTPVNHYVPFEYTVTAGAYTATRNLLLKVNMLVEDWETGDYTHFAWDNNVNIPWTTDNQVVLEGNYSSKSGDIGDNGITTMELTAEVLTNDSIAFHTKISTEEGWDFLHFYIDGDELGTWTGLQDWSRVAYPVTPGVHTFTWSYKKDEMMDGNADFVWVDFIELPNIKQTATGVSETTAESGHIKAYPNPSNGNATLLIDTKATGNVSVEVYNSVGQIVYSERVPAGQKQVELNTTAWAGGLYNIVARTANGTLNTRLAVK